MDLSHSALCQLAVKWLQRAPGADGPACQVAVAEVKCAETGEIPDAIGFRTVHTDLGSVVVEVKTSFADFSADRLKPHRQNGAVGMGRFRYYMTPAGLLTPSDIPPKWGLIEVSNRGKLTVICGHVKEPRSNQAQWEHRRALDREWLLLATLLSRVGDVDKLHQELKRVQNVRSQLARSNDELREKNRTLDRELFLANRPAGDGALLVAKRKIDALPRKLIHRK